jgi:hypothetical protein
MNLEACAGCQSSYPSEDCKYCHIKLMEDIQQKEKEIERLKEGIRDFINPYVEFSITDLYNLVEEIE